MWHCFLTTHFSLALQMRQSEFLSWSHFLASLFVITVTHLFMEQKKTSNYNSHVRLSYILSIIYQSWITLIYPNFSRYILSNMQADSISCEALSNSFDINVCKYVTLSLTPLDTACTLFVIRPKEILISKKNPEWTSLHWVKSKPLKNQFENLLSYST